VKTSVCAMFVWHYDLRAMAAQHKDLIRTIVRRQTENVI
jgi:hypothetical protein